MLFTKQLIFNSLITASNSSPFFPALSLSLYLPELFRNNNHFNVTLHSDRRTTQKTVESSEVERMRRSKQKESWKISLWKNNNELIYTSSRT